MQDALRCHAICAQQAARAFCFAFSRCCCRSACARLCCAPRTWCRRVLRCFARYAYRRRAFVFATTACYAATSQSPTLSFCRRYGSRVDMRRASALRRYACYILTERASVVAAKRRYRRAPCTARQPCCEARSDGVDVREWRACACRQMSLSAPDVTMPRSRYAPGDYHVTLRWRYVISACRCLARCRHATRLLPRLFAVTRAVFIALAARRYAPR